MAMRMGVCIRCNIVKYKSNVIKVNNNSNNNNNK